MSYTEHEHIQEWMANHDNHLLNSQYSKCLHEYLESLPWLPSKLDWSGIPHVFISLEEEGSAPDLELLTETPIGRHAYVMVSYRDEDRSILCRTEDAFHDADILYMRSPGPRYMCGADFEGDSVVLTVQDFAEYDMPGFTVSLQNR